LWVASVAYCSLAWKSAARRKGTGATSSRTSVGNGAVVGGRRKKRERSAQKTG